MSLYNMYYPCKCGTLFLNTVTGDTTMTVEMWEHGCSSCGEKVKLGTVSAAIMMVQGVN